MWSTDAHEGKVENLYAGGADGIGHYHNGYLNYGYWTKEGMTYNEAAEKMVDHMGELLQLTSESELLDCGCGMGPQDVYLYQKYHPKKIDAIDVTWKHVERARERIAHAGITPAHVSFHHESATALPWKDGTFSHVLAIESPPHFDTRENFFQEAWRVLQPGGVLAICDYTLGRPYENIFDRLLMKIVTKIWCVPPANVYSTAILQQKLQSIGFTNITVESVGALTIPGYYFESRRSEAVRAMYKLRGFWKGVVGIFCIDRGVYSVFRHGLVDYIMLRAQKPLVS